MADQSPDKVETAAPAANPQETSATEVKPGETELAGKEETATKEETKTDETRATEKTEKPADDATEKPSDETAKPAADGDAEMKDAGDTSIVDADQSTAAVETPAPKSKDRRKSTGDSKAKTLNKKGSKARILHTEAKPGDHFLVKLKGFPAWPAIVCDETMLPEALLSSRPVTAARPDGTYAENYADGGKRVYDRTFPVMYLYTNEFGWVVNTALTELTPEKAESTITDKTRKDLRAALELAAENNSLEFYKDMLQQILAELVAAQEAKREAANTPKKSKKGKAKAEEEDVEMVDSDSNAKPKSKKRKADDGTSTPQRSDSVKKPKIKLNTSSTPKTANGTPKNKDESTSKATKSKPKKDKEGADKKSEASKESKLTPEERRQRKEKEVLYLRHKLQRGLLTRDQQPQESEMKQMSEYVTMLENMQDLEVSIIRVTKINKVLKAILKLDSIPREEDFKFKSRSQTLLDKWNKLMAGDSAAPATATNGVNGGAESHAEKKTVEQDGKAGSEQPKSEKPSNGAEEKADGTDKEPKAAAEGDAEQKPKDASAESAPASSEAVEATA